jgi:hypothetical protein
MIEWAKLWAIVYILAWLAYDWLFPMIRSLGQIVGMCVGMHILAWLPLIIGNVYDWLLTTIFKSGPGCV